jgi:hydroxypyruvate reductase
LVFGLSNGKALNNSSFQAFFVQESAMKPEILMIAPMMPSVMNALETAYTVHKLWEATDRQELMARVATSIRGVATNGSVGIGGEIINALPNLEIIACYGVGVDAIDLVTAKTRGIPVTTTPDVLTADVADMAVGLMIATSRRLVRGDRYVRNLEWGQKGEMPLTRRVTGKRAGIVGLGRVGKALAKRLTAFEMNISYTDVKAQSDQPYNFVADLTELARGSDFLIVTAAGGAASRKMVNQTVLEALGAKGTLINVSRGSIVDEEALVAALEAETLGAAGLDVFFNEPNVPEALFKFENVVLMPHHSSGTIESRSAMGELIVDNLAAHFAGQSLLTPFVF